MPAALLLLIGIAYVVWSWTDQLGDYSGDNAFYLLTARHFSPWSPADPVAAYFAKTTLFPPLYSMLLAVFGGAESVRIAHEITTAFLILTLVALWCWLRGLRQPMAIAVGIPLIFALLPGTYRLALAIRSENVYCFFVVAAFACVTAFERNGRLGWLWTAAACISAAVLTRSVGVALVAAWLAFLAIQRPKGWALCAIGTLALPRDRVGGLNQPSLISKCIRQRIKYCNVRIAIFACIYESFVRFGDDRNNRVAGSFGKLGGDFFCRIDLPLRIGSRRQGKDQRILCQPKLCSGKRWWSRICRCCSQRNSIGWRCGTRRCGLRKADRRQIAAGEKHGKNSHKYDS